MIPKYYRKNRQIAKVFRIKNIIQYIRFRITTNNNYRINYLRKKGVKIGENCLINHLKIVAEPYLVEIGNEVAIAPKSIFITHDGSTWLFKDKSKDLRLYGKIIIGNNCFIAESCIILPNTRIGNNCIIGAGSVVRGNIPDNSLAMGNPAEVIMNTSMAKLFIMKKKFILDAGAYNDSERRKAVEALFDS